jgi:hypothetical protein
MRMSDAGLPRTVISALLLRDDDPLLLISSTDLTEMPWMTCRLLLRETFWEGGIPVKALGSRRFLAGGATLPSRWRQ